MLTYNKVGFGLKSYVDSRHTSNFMTEFQTLVNNFILDISFLTNSSKDPRRSQQHAYAYLLSPVFCRNIVKYDKNSFSTA